MEKFSTILGEVDIHPKEGEYWTPIREYHVCEFDISNIDRIFGFIIDESCGSHLLEIIEEVLGYRPSKSKIHNIPELNEIQFSFSNEEFDLKKVYDMSLLLSENRMGIITKDILESCKLTSKI